MSAAVDPQGPDGTARVDARGPAGTARVSEVADQGASGTQRVGALAGPVAAGPAVAEGAQDLGVGQSALFNGRNYRIESELTTTTSEARTYVVVDGGGQRMVLKRYRPGIRAPQAVLARIQATPHANVVSIVDFGSEAGQDFEILSYMAGGTLDQMIRTQGPIRDVSQLRWLTAQIVDGLTHLHEQVGMIYQDLKPENILISGPDLAQVVLADFGISTLRQPDSPDVQVTANGTREYAAPELARFGNETKTFVTDKVDYFALGITLLECWQGTRPFQGMMEGRRAAMIQDRDIPFPSDMDASLKILIKGLVSPSAKDRFGQEQVRRWIAGQPLSVDYSTTQRKYEVKHFPSGESFETPEQLALLMEKYPEIGKDFLFYDSIQKWLDASGDMGLSTDIRKIALQYNGDEDQKSAGLLRAIYVLDKNRPFTSAGGRTCTALEEMADALLAEKEHYTASLNNPFDPFYLFLHARAEGEFAAETLSRFVSSMSASLAFNQLIYAMHGAGRNRIQIAGRYFYLPEELKDAPAEVHAEVIESLRQPDSRLLLWLQRLGYIEKLAPLGRAEPHDQLGVVRAMPWLRLADFIPDLIERQGAMACSLIRRHRTTLFDVFVEQGLGFNATHGGAVPLVMAATSGNVELVGFMLDHGADIHRIDGDGDTALAIAVQLRNREMVELLLARGADVHAVDTKARTCLGHSLTESNIGGVQRPVEPSMVDRLLEAGAAPNQPTHDGRLPLHLALVCNPLAAVPALVESLLKAGADVHTAGPNLVIHSQGPCSALFCALYAYHFQFNSSADYLPVIERLLRAGARIDEKDQDKAPLHLATLWGDPSLVDRLLRAGADPNQPAHDNRLPLHMALLCEPVDVVLTLVEHLLKAGADIHRLGPNLVVKAPGPCNALFSALYAYHFRFGSRADYLPVIERLLQAGARLDEADQDKAPLHLAAGWNDESLAKLLISRGAKTDHAIADMLPGTYARLAGATGLEALLDPGAALLRRCRWYGWRTQLLKSLAMLLLMAPMVPVGSALAFMWRIESFDTPWWIMGVTMAVLLSGRLLVAGSWLDFKSGLRTALGSAKGWLSLFLIEPAALAFGAAGMILLARLGGEDHDWLRILAQHVWIDLGVAMLAVAMAARSRAKTASAVRALDKYRAANTKGNTQPATSWVGSLVMTLILAVLIGTPVVLVLRMGGKWAAQPSAVSTAVGAQSAGAPPPGLGTKPLPGQNRPGADTSSGTLSASFPVIDRGNTICTLAPGTQLTRLHDAPRNFPEPRLLVTVLRPPPSCAARLAGNEVAIPVSIIRRSGGDNAPKTAKSPEASAAARSNAESGAPANSSAATPANNAPASGGRTIAGPVQGLSADGWPNVGGQVVRLHGLAAIAPDQRTRFEAWLAARENTLQCEPQASSSYRCLTNARTDVAEALLLNGAATATGDAPAAYKEAMARAMTEKRGQWK